MIYSNVSSGAVSITEYFHPTQIPALAPAQKKAGIRARLHSRQAEPKNIFFGIHSPRSGIRSDKENKSNHICSRFTTTWRQIHTCKSARWQGQQWCLKKRKNRILFFFLIFFWLLSAKSFSCTFARTAAQGDRVLYLSASHRHLP